VRTNARPCCDVRCGGWQWQRVARAAVVPWYVSCSVGFGFALSSPRPPGSRVVHLYHYCSVCAQSPGIHFIIHSRHASLNKVATSVLCLCPICGPYHPIIRVIPLLIECSPSSSPVASDCSATHGHNNYCHNKSLSYNPSHTTVEDTSPYRMGEMTLDIDNDLRGRIVS
jgi:hypothetical protein